MLALSWSNIRSAETRRLVRENAAFAHREKTLVDLLGRERMALLEAERRITELQAEIERLTQVAK